MPRRSRLVFPGIALHVIQRGNNRAACFFEESDRDYYLFHLERLAIRHGCAIHAYCLMTNHLHLLMTPSSASGCADLMRRLGQFHAHYVNRTYSRTGSLWEGRFRSCLVQSEEYVLMCYRYIELNPVRAGMVVAPGEYRWSSFRANALGARNSLLTPHGQYLDLGATDEERRAAYAALFGSTLGTQIQEQIREAARGDFALGSKSFQSEMSQRLGRRVQKAKSGRPRIRAGNNEKQAELLDPS